ncbi:TraC family protein [Brucella sp. NBRC 12950]|uniref:TraC family protein n=1 Tax=Brucella sp. NBRC 12950 TaxID=2994518 RepID=UPI0024A47C9A|nr:TraC family protein [Brucella sp. NBRC 12950]GLU29528.1 hypothetical protein Brsp01_47610 [Brucella sp. NBRC 12950]
MARSKTKKSVALIKAEIRSLNEEPQAALILEAQKIGELAIAVGLSDMPLYDLKPAFKELAERLNSNTNRRAVTD